MRKPHYLTLDAARGVAALAVMVLHIGNITGRSLAPGAYLAVDFFFVLSGLVVASAYEARLVDGLNLRAFTLIRLRRLYPLYLIGTLMGLGQILVASAVHHSIPDPTGLAVSVAAALLMLPGRFAAGRALFPLNRPAWSLFFEMAVNLLYAKLARRLSMPALWAFAAVGIAGLVATVVHYHSLDSGSHWLDLWGGFARVCFGFFTGVLLHRLLGRTAPAPSNAVVLFVLAVLVLALVGAPGGSASDLIVVVGVFPPLVALGALVQPTGLLALAAGRAGALSYALYAVHYPVISALRPVLHALGLSTPATVLTMGAAACGAAVTCDALLSIASDRRRPTGARSPDTRTESRWAAADAD